MPHIGGSTEESIYGARIFMIKKLLKIIQKIKNMDLVRNIKKKF